MASNKRKQDEKHLKILREMVSLPSNKQCFDCHQRGPTYVNMTIGSFVCTSCSGILRGLNPPHRVKSISMASFTPEEMDFLKCHGNELNRKVFLGLYDSRSWPEPDSRDEQRVRDYMVQKYENKRWYVAPTEAMKEEAKRANEAALNSKPQVKPLRSLLGENAPKLQVGTAHAPTSHPHPHVSAPPPTAGFKSPPAVSGQAQAQVVSASTTKPASGFDLLGDLGGDPFASSAPASNNHGDGGFADFSNFDSMNSTPSHTPAVASVNTASQAFPISSTPLQPLSRVQASGPIPTTSHQTVTISFPSMSDKYAALADLDSAFSAPTTTATSINWGGTADGGIINWGGVSSTASTPSQSTSGVSWSSSTAGSGAINWNSQGSASVGIGSSPSASGFGAPTPVYSHPGKPGNPFINSMVANPFGGVVTTGMPTYSSTAPASTINPFGTAATTSMPMSHFTQAGGMMTGMSVSTAPGYGGQFAVAGQLAAGYGQFPPMQNGGFGMTPTTAAFGAQPQFMMPAQPGLMQQAGGWGQMGAVPSQPVANPFLNTTMHQVPPPSGSTNPFL